MKKLIKLFSLTSVLALCVCMTLLTNNKINVKAQEVEITANVYLPIPSGFYVYDYPDDTKLYFLYNTMDNGGKYYQSLINFGSNPSLPGAVVVDTSMKQLIESTPRQINDVPTIKTALLYAITSNASISITVQDFYIYDVSTWFKQVLENYSEYDLYYIQRNSISAQIPIESFHFFDLQDLANTQLNKFGIDISNTATNNSEVDADFYYNHGWNVGYNEGHQVGYNSGFDIGYNSGYDDGRSVGYNDGYDDGYEDGLESDTTEAYNKGYNKGLSDAFINGFSNWITPVIALVIFGGGIFMLINRKREV